MSEKDRKDIRKYMILILFAGVVFCIFTNLSAFFRIIGGVFSVTKPFILGGAIAFIMNGPYEFTVNKILRFNLKTPERTAKVKKILGIILSYLFVLAIVVVLIAIVSPQLIASIGKLVNYIPKDSTGLMAKTNEFLGKYLKDERITGTLMEMSGSLGQAFKKFLSSAVPSVASSVSSIVGNVVSTVIALVVSIYILVDKKHLSYQCRLLTKAYLREDIADKVINLASLTSDTFSDFISGQLIDAAVLGTICAITLAVLRFPYALLIGTIIGCTNIIPYFGPFIGTVPCLFMLALEKPIYGLAFLVIIVLLQQLDSKVLYPNIVGGSVGLGPLFVTFAIIVGGGVFGVAGMIIGVPVLAVIYTLIRESAYGRIRKKGLDKQDV